MAEENNVDINDVMSRIELLVDLQSEFVAPVLELLLKDKTTKHNIIWATDSYQGLGVGFEPKSEMTNRQIQTNDIIKPRTFKSIANQDERTKSKGEVFTPLWICCKMNNYCDDVWFGRENVFNVMSGKNWETTFDAIDFGAKRWQDYVYSRRIEITCGEAPFLVSRYNAATGESVDISQRIGILDRKLRVVGENVQSEEEWLKWTTRAFQSVYGYEFQGDNLLIARINLLMTFVEYLNVQWNRKPTSKELRAISNIICWNIWQMDGLKCCIPMQEPHVDTVQLSIFDEPPAKTTDYDCRIFDWRANESVKFKNLKNKK